MKWFCDHVSMKATLVINVLWSRANFRWNIGQFAVIVFRTRFQKRSRFQKEISFRIAKTSSGTKERKERRRMVISFKVFLVLKHCHLGSISDAISEFSPAFLPKLARSTGGDTAPGLLPCRGGHLQPRHQWCHRSCRALSQNAPSSPQRRSGHSIEEAWASSSSADLRPHTLLPQQTCPIWRRAERVGAGKWMRWHSRQRSRRTRSCWHWMSAVKCWGRLPA